MGEAERQIPNAHHEPKDIGESSVWIATACMLGLLGFCALLIVWLYPEAMTDRTLSLPLAVYPAPRLQTSPAADMRSFHAREMQRLNGTGWVDKAHGIVHIPISEAMDRIAREGIPGWPAAAPPAAAPGPSP